MNPRQILANLSLTKEYFMITLSETQTDMQTPNDGNGYEEGSERKTKRLTWAAQKN